MCVLLFDNVRADVPAWAKSVHSISVFGGGISFLRRASVPCLVLCEVLCDGATVHLLDNPWFNACKQGVQQL